MQSGTIFLIIIIIIIIFCLFLCFNRNEYFNQNINYSQPQLQISPNTSDISINSNPEFPQNKINMNDLVECGIDVNSIQNIFTEINDIIKNNGVNSDWLTSDALYSKVEQLTNIITKYDSNKIKCVIEKTSNKSYCASADRPFQNITMEQIDVFNNGVDKYRPILNQWYNWFMNNYTDLEADCGTDINKINKLRQIISKISTIVN